MHRHQAPFGTLHAGEGLRHVIGASAAGMPVNAVLVDDGVYLAKRGQEPGATGWIDLAAAMQQAITSARSSAAPRARVRVHRPSLETRGLEMEDLVPGVELINDEELAALLATAGGVLAF